MADETYEIQNGVRRAKIYLSAGRSMIAAKIYHPDGHLLKEANLAIDRLLSPKSVIDLTRLVSHKIQYLQMEAAATRGVVFPAIEVIAGTIGTPIRDVMVIR